MARATCAVFGSVARGEATATSDLDVLVDFDAGRSLFDLAGFEHALEDFLGCKVDVRRGWGNQSVSGKTDPCGSGFTMNDDQSYLQHIRELCRRVADYTRDGRDFFMADTKTQDAVIRNIEIIGEAAKNLSESLCLAHPGTPWKQIARMRDKLIHRYFGVNLELVWEVVATHLPTLLAEVESILNAVPSSPPAPMPTDPNPQKAVDAMNTPDPAPSLNFIQEIIEEHNRTGRFGGRVAHAVSAGAERLSAHRPRQVDLPELRPGVRDTAASSISASTTPTRPRKSKNTSIPSATTCAGSAPTGKTANSTPPIISINSTTGPRSSSATARPTSAT